MKWLIKLNEVSFGIELKAAERADDNDNEDDDDDDNE